MVEKKAPAAAAKAAPKKAEKAPSKTAGVPAAATSKRDVHEAGRGYRRTMVGRVIRDKMDKTVVVETVSARRDALYGKYVRTRSRYKAHDATNQYKIGDQVEIRESAPMSRDKRFTVVRLVKKFIEE